MEKEKKEYEVPKIDVVQIEAEESILASGVVKFFDLKDKYSWGDIEDEIF